MTSTNTATNIQYGKSYTTTLNLTDDYVLETINVVMNSLDITKSAYNEKTGKITIEEVTGDIELIAKNHIDVSMVPEEFYYVGGTKSTGLVISDNSKDENKGVDYTCVGNQFVWVPVDDYSKFVRGEAEETYDGSGIYKMTGVLNAKYAEPYTSGYSSEQSEYGAMCVSVKKYGGFYIARFEAGDGDASEPRTTATEAHTVVSKKGAYVYNYVPWGISTGNIVPTSGYYIVEGATLNFQNTIAGAVYLSQHMYEEYSTVVSTLCYGVQWDSVMNFVSDAEHDIKSSVSWGNYWNSTGDAAINCGSSNMNYTTGRNEAWKAQNIYDLAGNVQVFRHFVVSAAFQITPAATEVFAQHFILNNYKIVGVLK